MTFTTRHFLRRNLFRRARGLAASASAALLLVGVARAADASAEAPAAPPATPLAWEATEISHLVAPDAKELKVEFAFRNTTDRVINILSIKTSCSCTIADLADKELAPGEAGRLAVTLELPETSSREKTIFVRTDDAVHPAYVLTVAGRKADYLRVVAPDLVWRVGEPATPRTVEVTVDPTYAGTIQLTAVEADAATVDLQQETVTPGKAWRFVVGPRSTAAALVTKVTLVTDLPVEVGRRLALDVWVLDPPAARDAAAVTSPDAVPPPAVAPPAVAP